MGIIKPIILTAKRGGGKRRAMMRDVVNSLMYVLSSRRQWRYIPKDLPPRGTVYWYFCDWRYDGTLDEIQHALYVRCREKLERKASSTAWIVDSQSVKSAKKWGADRSAWL